VTWFTSASNAKPAKAGGATLWVLTKEVDHGRQMPGVGLGRPRRTGQHELPASGAARDRSESGRVRDEPGRRCRARSTAGGKKYEVLKDETGRYIAGLRSGYPDRWYQKMKPAETPTIWMKFPAPPAEVKAVTLQLPGAPPFEDLAIQGS
jgi:hypothetical protein